MSIEENKATVRRVNEEVCNKHNLDAVDVYFALNYSADNPYQRGATGLEAVKQKVAYALNAFPGMHYADDLIAEGDKVVHRWPFRGTHQGEFMNVPPTGKEVRTTGITIYRNVGGKIVEEWAE